MSIDEKHTIQYCYRSLSNYIQFVQENKSKGKWYVLNKGVWEDYSNYEPVLIVEFKIKEIIFKELNDILDSLSKIPYYETSQIIPLQNRRKELNHLKEYLKIYGIHSNIFSQIKDFIMLNEIY